MATRQKFRVVMAAALVWSLLLLPGFAHAQGGVDPLVEKSVVDAGDTDVETIAVTDGEVYFALDAKFHGGNRETYDLGSVSFDPVTGELDGNATWRRTFDSEDQNDTDFLHGEASGVTHVAVSPDGAYVYFVMSGLDAFGVSDPPRLIRVDTATKDLAVLPITMNGSASIRAFALSPDGKYAFLLDAASNGRLSRVHLSGQICLANVTCGGMGEDIASHIGTHRRRGVFSFAAGQAQLILRGDATSTGIVEVDLAQMKRTNRALGLVHPEYQQEESWINTLFSSGNSLYVMVTDGRDVAGTLEERGRLVKVDPVTFAVTDELILGGQFSESYVVATDPTGTYAYLLDDQDDETLLRVNLDTFTVVDTFVPNLATNQKIWALATSGRHLIVGTTAQAGASRLIALEGAEVALAPLNTQNPQNSQIGPSVVAPVAANFSGMVACEATRLTRFVDVPVTSTHASAIGCLFAGEIVTGFGEDTFRPHAAMTRGQVASMLFRVLVNAGWEPVAGDASFVDVAGVHQDAIVGLANAGIVSGFADGRFAPDVPVTRGQFASMLVRASEVAGRPLATATPSFHDVPLGSLHASAVGALEEAGMVAGFADGTFRPESRVTRGQVASLLVRWLDPSGTVVAGSVR